MRAWKKRTSLGLVAAVVGGFLVGTLIQTRNRGRSPTDYPRWSCATERAPVKEVTDGLLTLAGFSGRDRFEQFVASNEVDIARTYGALQTAMRDAERRLLQCVRGLPASEGGPVSVELSWRLESSRQQARASDLRLWQYRGPEGLREGTSRCLETLLSDKTFEARATAEHPFVEYQGIFPFPRKLRLGARPTS